MKVAFDVYKFQTHWRVYWNSFRVPRKGYFSSSDFHRSLISLKLELFIAATLPLGFIIGRQTTSSWHKLYQASSKQAKQASSFKPTIPSQVPTTFIVTRYCLLSPCLLCVALHSHIMSSLTSPQHGSGQEVATPYTHQPWATENGLSTPTRSESEISAENFLLIRGMISESESRIPNLPPSYEEWPEIPILEGITRKGIAQTPQFSENTRVRVNGRI